MIGLLIVVGAILLGIFLARSMPKKKPAAPIVEETLEDKLGRNVAYYNKLSPGEQDRFKNEVQHFLQQVTITGVNTNVSEKDRILVAASAIIPIFAFAGWRYPNLNEVLLYPDMFSETYDLSKENADRRILGMVGSGAMNRVMILSKPALEAGFQNKTDKHNTAIHEFVHLVDKSDGEVDGLPEVLADKTIYKPWLKLMREEIEAIRENESDINPYGATNEAEFFAVASEYFFERPLLFQEKHPELYQLMEKIFRQQPQTDTSEADATSKIL